MDILLKITEGEARELLDALSYAFLAEQERAREKYFRLSRKIESARDLAYDGARLPERGEGEDDACTN